MTIIIVIIYYRYATLKGNIQSEARKIFDGWRQSELEAAKTQVEQALEEKYKGLFSQWCQAEEGEIRRDAVARSQAVVLGRVTEHIAPYMPEFEFNPRDARFIGSPIDLIVFNGLTEGDLKSIVFVEIKSGESQITSRERKIRDVINEGLVEWRELRISTAQGREAEEGEEE